MKYSQNNNLKLPEGTDNVKRQDFIDNFVTIDNGLSAFYTAILDDANNYKINTGLSKTSLANGYSIKVAIPSSSTGAVTITVDSVTVPVKKPNGNAITNFKANSVYNLTYYNGNFICASGADESDSTSVGTDGSNVLAPYTFVGTDGEVHTGTIPTIKQNANLNCGGSFVIPKGYHTGEERVTANSLASQTDANATASTIVSGHTAWVNGQKITGSATVESMGGKRYTTGKITSAFIAENWNALVIHTPSFPFTPTIVTYRGEAHIRKDTYTYEYDETVECRCITLSKVFGEYDDSTFIQYSGDYRANTLHLNDKKANAVGQFLYRDNSGGRITKIVSVDVTYHAWE